MILEDVCRHRVHCVACRSDAKWRESLFKLGVVEKIDFTCPHGFTAQNAPKAPHIEPNGDLRCIHRGKETRRVKCPSCRGDVMAKIMACDIHGECSSFSKPVGVKSCIGCADLKIDEH